MSEAREEFKEAYAEKVTGGAGPEDGTYEYCDKCGKITQHIDGECIECKITPVGCVRLILKETT